MLPAVLLASALAADGTGAHGLARNALLAALPFAAVGALVRCGDYLESRDASLGFRAICLAAAVGLVVLSCAVRSGAGNAAPPLAVSSLLASSGLLGLELLAGALVYARRLGGFTPAKP